MYVHFHKSVYSYDGCSTFKGVLCSTDCTVTVNNSDVSVQMLVNSVSLYKPTFMCTAEQGCHADGGNGHECDNG